MGKSSHYFLTCDYHVISPQAVSQSAWTTRRPQTCHVTQHTPPPRWGQGSGRRTEPAEVMQMFGSCDICAKVAAELVNTHKNGIPGNGRMEFQVKNTTGYAMHWATVTASWLLPLWQPLCGLSHSVIKMTLIPVCVAFRCITWRIISHMS